MTRACLGFRGAVLLMIAGLLGCSHRASEERTGGVGQAVVTSLSMTFPAGVGRLDAPVNASTSIKLADNVKVLDNASEPGGTSNSGTGETYIGPGTIVGRVTTRGTVNLRAGSVVGDVIASGAITKLPGAKVTGAEVTNATLTPVTTVSFGIDFPSTVPAEIMVEPNTVRTLTAGNYSSVVVKPTGTLILGQGDFTFRTLDLQADSTTYLRDGVKVSVRDQPSVASGRSAPSVLPQVSRSMRATAVVSNMEAKAQRTRREVRFGSGRCVRSPIETATR